MFNANSLSYIFSSGNRYGLFVVHEKASLFSASCCKPFPYKIVDRREGDVTMAYASTEKANSVLGWKTESTLDEAIKSAWKWEQKVRAK